MKKGILMPVDDAVLQQRALDRARQIAGHDEYRLANSWLSDLQILIVPEDNENHAGEHNADRLARACAVYPSGRWFAAGVYAGEPYDLLEVADPSRALSWGPEGRKSLGAVYAGQSFLLFSLDRLAAILYSEHEYALVSGSREFVGAYFGDIEEARRVFDDSLAEQRKSWSENDAMVEEIDRRALIIQDQMRMGCL